MSLNCPATKAMLIMPKILMSCCGSTRYPDWCLDDRISSPHQYQTITPTQVLSETLGKASWGKNCVNCDRWWTHLLSIKRLCNKSTLMLFNLYWEAEMYLCNQLTPGFESFHVHKRNNLLRNDVFDKWFSFVTIIKIYYYSWSIFTKRPFFCYFFM